MAITDEEMENRSMELLVAIRLELQAALNAVHGKPIQSLLEKYKVHAARHAYRATDGYVYLRQGGRTEASKHLIRTTIEVLFRLQALEKKPGTLYQIAYTEFLQDKAVINTLRHGNVAADIAAKDAEWAKFRAQFQMIEAPAIGPG